MTNYVNLFVLIGIQLYLTVSASVGYGNGVTIWGAVDDMVAGRIFRAAINPDRSHHTFSNLSFLRVKLMVATGN
jgi:hypothetical protein